MRMTAILISLIGLVLSLQGALSSYCTVTEYSSPVSYYIKFTQQTNQNYDSWASVCTGLGDGWDVAKIEDEFEYNFINQAHLSEYIQRDYFIGGRTDVFPSGSSNPMILEQKYGFSETGDHRIAATTHFGELAFLSQIRVAQNDGVLCEKDKNQDRGHEFSSATSYYRKLVNDSSFNPFSYWNEMCRTELGEGWAIAVMETRRELDFISRTQVWYSDIRHYYIGGYSSYGNRHLIDACTLDHSGAGSNRVFVGTWRNGFKRDEFKLRTARPSRPVPGVLCEKHKAEV